jgi:dissimilatory sulfite reductase (desulfoviridin) alpha/beta subunit
MHRPALPYKMKFKVSGCANDCMNSIERSDFATIGFCMVMLDGAYHQGMH